MRFLVDSQREDGTFPQMIWYLNRANHSNDRLFSTSCIVLAIGEILPPSNLEKALKFVQQSRDSEGLWHFDSGKLLPADADDTACAAAVLLRFGSWEERRVLEPLKAFVRRDGSIATWLGSGPLGNEMVGDIVVAANVIYAFALVDKNRAREILCQWISSKSQLSLKYYLCPETAIYAWTRALSVLSLGPPACSVKSYDQCDSPLRCALAISAGVNREKIMLLLLDSQNVKGSWSAEPWFSSRDALFGSESLTTAIALEALNHYRQE